MLTAKRRERLSYGISIVFHIGLLLLLALTGFFTFQPPTPPPVEVTLVGGGQTSGSTQSGSPAQAAASVKLASPDAIMEYVANAEKVLQEKAPNAQFKDPAPTTNPSANGTGGTDGSPSGTHTGTGNGNGKGSNNGTDSGENDGPGNANTVAQPARIIHQVLPTFPPEAILNDEEASFTVYFVVDASGNVNEVEILSSNVPSSFVQSAKQALRQWRFDPARNAAGQPIPSSFTIPLHFKLTDY